VSGKFPRWIRQCVGEESEERRAVKDIWKRLQVNPPLPLSSVPDAVSECARRRPTRDERMVPIGALPESRRNVRDYSR